MADSNWDNGGGRPTGKGMGAWAKFGLGCGIALVLGMGTCAGGCVYLKHRVEKDPDGLKRSVLGFVKQFIQEDWEDLRRMVDQLGSDDGSRGLYRSAPGLKASFPTEEGFVEASRRWRPALEPLPAEIPDLEAHDLSYNNQIGGAVVLSYRQKNGARIRFTWDGKRRKGVSRTSQLVDIEIRP